MAERLGPNDLQPHGTREARQNHLAHGEELCAACRALDAELGYESRRARSDQVEVGTP